MTEPLITPTMLRTRLKTEQATTDSTLNEYIKATHSKIVLALGFDYPRKVQERTLDATRDPVLVLPGAGALRILSVVENDTTLTADDYELDPDDGRYLRRLDTNGKSMDWICGDRKIVVRYLPARPPEALVDAEMVESVRAYRGAQSGYADRMGPDDVSIPFRHALASDTMLVIERIKRGGGWGVW